MLRVFSDVFGRLYRKFGLEPQVPTRGGTGLYPMILPITSVDDLLDYQALRRYDLTLSGTGIQTLAQVPDGERWRVYLLFISQESGDRLINSIMIGDRLTDDVVRYTDTDATGARYISGPINAFDMTAGMRLQCNFAGGATDGTYSIRLLLTVSRQEWVEPRG
jgi:hypothetical protein